ncbi:NAD(P)-binding domain [Pleurostoma richardsiae]|uniref:NAD(P)-binding domain n=1 Tax=Pleurostoma richardsiae TaxID=41990 RepID=A0AA38VJC2_9PEZI|nr:NAD(P)-binding domain [Pleurostoma richardsiae]
MSSPRRTLLITGATGKQGGALITSLVGSPSTASLFTIVAVSRDPASPSAKRLAALGPHVSVLAGDLADPADLLRRAEAAAGSPVWGVYSVQINSPAEQQQGKALVDVAASHGVRHFVYSSGDRGGPERSAVDATDVANFAAKFHIERHLMAACAASGGEKPQMTYTILRPVSFFENLDASVHGRGFARMWEQMGASKLQMVSTADIGRVAAQSFARAGDAAFRNAALTLAGDELTQAEADAVFREVLGFAMPLAPCPVASAVKFFLKGTVGDMFRWFEREGYGADVEECRRLYPGMRDFRAWIEENKGLWVR